jgi:VWFA-related protein
MTIRRAILLGLLALAALSQVKVESVNKQARFESVTDLVVVDVTVRDRAGNPIEGLKKEDFTIFEDGKPQKISAFEMQKLTLDPLPPATPPAPVLKAARTEAAPAIPPVRPKTPNPPGQRRPDRRLLVMFFDFSGMGPPEQIRAQKAALDFVEKKMTAADLVSVLTFSTSLKVAQEFTDDREALTQIIRSFRVSSISDLAGVADVGDDETEEDTGAAFVADQTEFNIFNTDRKLAALESAVKMLATMPEKKALIYFSSGVTKTGVENQSQLRATVNAAVRANVAFYPVDARGLSALPPGGDASHASSRGSGMFTGRSQGAQRERFNDQQETLTTLAADTGGKALLDSNDLSLGITQAQSDVRSYYILAYYSTNPQHDGRYRRIRVTLAGHAEAKLDYRSGYFAPKQLKQFTAADKEQQLQEALLLGDPVTDLPLALEADFFRVSGDRYFVPVAVKIPGSEISLSRKGSNEETTFDFIGQVRDERDKLAGAVRDVIKVKLDASNAAQLGRRHLQYDTGFTLMPGRYKLKFLARENQTGKMGTFETSFVVPNLANQQSSLRLSSVVWSSQLEPLQAAVGAAEKKSKTIADHPLVHDGQKLVPSITRVFRKDQNLYVYFEVYDPATDPAQKAPEVAATLSFYRESVKAFESEPIRVTQSPGRKQALPFQFQVPLASLAPGRYTCQVNVVDEVGRKFAFPRSPLVLLP